MPLARHRGMRPADRLLLAAVALMVSVAACSAAPADPIGPTTSGASRGSDDRANPVDVGGGRTIFLECHGTGSPTVVLLSGFGNAGDVWQVAETHAPTVAVGVASFTRVCLYDRPGSYVTSVVQNGTRSPVVSVDQVTPARGNALFPGEPRSGTEVVQELHELLATAHVPPPYVLAGHSLGGVLSLLYARTYPDQVAGIVLVDPPTPNFPERLSPAAWAGNVAALADPGPSRIPGYAGERYRLDLLFAEISRAGPLPAVPVTDLVRTINDPVPEPLPAGLTAAGFAEIQTEGLAAAAAYVNGIPGARIYPVTNATHNLHTERPDLVIAAIRDEVNGTTMTAPATSR